MAAVAAAAAAAASASLGVAQDQGSFRKSWYNSASAASLSCRAWPWERASRRPSAVSWTAAGQSPLPPSPPSPSDSASAARSSEARAGVVSCNRSSHAASPSSAWRSAARNSEAATCAARVARTSSTQPLSSGNSAEARSAQSRASAPASRCRKASRREASAAARPWERRSRSWGASGSSTRRSSASSRTSSKPASSSASAAVASRARSSGSTVRSSCSRCSAASRPPRPKRRASSIRAASTSPLSESTASQTAAARRPARSAAARRDSAAARPRGEAAAARPSKASTSWAETFGKVSAQLLQVALRKASLRAQSRCISPNARRDSASNSRKGVDAAAADASSLAATKAVASSPSNALARDSKRPTVLSALANFASQSVTRGLNMLSPAGAAMTSRKRSQATRAAFRSSPARRHGLFGAKLEVLRAACNSSNASADAGSTACCSTSPSAATWTVTSCRSGASAAARRASKRRANEAWSFSEMRPALLASCAWRAKRFASSAEIAASNMSLADFLRASLAWISANSWSSAVFATVSLPRRSLRRSIQPSA
mmetsp:Transcript_24972/g.66369  ORF Transcript_24972/g.66369 Transcript_24972/m.66369 type:complete len:549 (-) Transcript_24972:1265-2911(-)